MTRRLLAEGLGTALLVATPLLEMPTWTRRVGVIMSFLRKCARCSRLTSSPGRSTDLPLTVCHRPAAALNSWELAWPA